MKQKNIEVSKEQVAHDLAMLVVKSKMDGDKIHLLGEMVDEYIQQYSDFMKVLETKYSDRFTK
ncbi:hypothetical protein [Caldifermentibacillus hisashii]|uniref:hypothetical protein n=1 Tax=Caldifermentibacillus hisashii TaxID=996558 RepID=UPI001C103F46|nr:hypothetical protein [Caldifermentibacillus hisashii]MBU5342269.1 hypothetical protein [Caldifermentibacillus hisashii]